MPFAAGKVDPSEAGKKGNEKRWGPQVVAEGPVDVLAEMEALLSRRKEDDRTDFQKRLRKQYEEDFDAFMDRLVKKRKGESGGRAEEAEGPDEGSRDALAVLDRVIEELAGGSEGGGELR